MPYSQDLNFSDWAYKVTQTGTNIISLLEKGELDYQKFYAFTYGKQDSDILAMPGFSGRTEADLTALRYALAAVHDLFLAMTNGVITQRDRQGDMIPFI